MNTVLIVAAVIGLIVLLAIFVYMLTRRSVESPRAEARPRAETRSPRRAPFSMSPLPPLSRPVSGAGRYDSGDDSSAILAASMSAEPAHHHGHAHATAATHETHTAPSHDHGSSYGGDSYGGHHDGGSSYSGGHDSGGGFDGGGGHSH